MVMSWIWTIFLAVSIVCAAVTGRGSQLAAALPEGAQKGLTLAISLAGSLCLWSGAARLMEAVGLTALLARLLKPLLGRLFPAGAENDGLMQALSGNVCANLLGLGNAATPMGISAARQLARSPGARDQLCRLVVMNTASIQLIPTTVAALRGGLGAAQPFAILPAVWLCSGCSLAVGLGACRVLERVWKP